MKNDDFEERNRKAVERGIEILNDNLSIKNKFTHVGREVVISNDIYCIDAYDNIEDQYFLNMCIESRQAKKDILCFTSGWVSGNMFRKRLIEGDIFIV
ncbi:hypothetical protein [Nostoc phage N1]|nr:hypothetical protein [Nostoc phage N1]